MAILEDKRDLFLRALEEELVKFVDLNTPEADSQAQTFLGPTVRRATSILSRRTKRADWTNRVTGKSGRGHIDAVRTDGSGVTGQEDRPSVRHQKAGRGDGPIYLNWGFEYDGSQNAFLITNRARHMGILLRGSPGHPVPLRRLQNRYLRFWRGRPLKWDAGPNDIAGWNFRRQIDHPGIRGMEEEYQNYFEESYDEATNDRRYDQAVDNYFQARVRILQRNIGNRLD